MSTISSPVGSSPRMRGALEKATKLYAEERIIPADTGSTQAVMTT